jgi:hypothetical protein
MTSATACDFDAAAVVPVAGVAGLFAEAELDPCGVFDRTMSAHDFGGGLAAGTGAVAGTSCGSAGGLLPSLTACLGGCTLISGAALSALVVTAGAGCFEVTAGTAGRMAGRDEAGEPLSLELAAPFIDDGAARAEPVSERASDVAPTSDGDAFVDVWEVTRPLVPS